MLVFFVNFSRIHSQNEKEYGKEEEEKIVVSGCKLQLVIRTSGNVFNLENATKEEN